MHTICLLHHGVDEDEEDDEDGAGDDDGADDDHDNVFDNYEVDDAKLISKEGHQWSAMHPLCRLHDGAGDDDDDVDDGSDGNDGGGDDDEANDDNLT